MQQTLQTNFQTREMTIAAAALEPNQFESVSAGTGPAYGSPGNQLMFQITGEESGGAKEESSRRLKGTLIVQVVGGTVNAAPEDCLAGRSYKFQVIGEETGGAEQESFHLLKGTLAVQIDEKTVNASPRGFVYLSGRAFPRS